MESTAVMEQHLLLRSQQPNRLVPTQVANLVHLDRLDPRVASVRPLHGIAPGPGESAHPGGVLMTRRPGVDPSVRAAPARVVPPDPGSPQATLDHLLDWRSLPGLVGRMAWLQLVQAPDLEQRARRCEPSAPNPWGNAVHVDRTGCLVAMDEKRFWLWAHPATSTCREMPPTLSALPKMWRRCWPIPGSSCAALLRAVGTQASGIKLAEELDPETADRTGPLESAALIWRPIPSVYPQASLFANVVGFLNAERQPQAGLSRADGDLPP